MLANNIEKLVQENLDVTENEFVKKLQISHGSYLDEIKVKKALALKMLAMEALKKVQTLKEKKELQRVRKWLDKGEIPPINYKRLQQEIKRLLSTDI